MVEAGPRSGVNPGLSALRARFVEITRRRVEGDAVEDIVQDALSIVHEKGAGVPGGSDGLPPLPWCFTVLRNVIGNHYQRERTRSRAAQAGSMEHAQVEALAAGQSPPGPLEALERAEMTRLLEQAIEELSAKAPDCGRLLRAMLGRTEEASEAPDGTASTRYVRAFRCRRRLREILLRMGVRP
jgi:DNA-directed RNA polymerase specialized sigma24 family protein